MPNPPASAAVRFNDCINDRDVDGLADLMTDDHTFIDTEGGTVTGKQAALEAWRGFFAAFPDYRNVFTSVAARGEIITIVGHSVCSEPALAGPAIWTAKVTADQVAEWRVHADTQEIRARLDIEDSR